MSVDKVDTHLSTKYGANSLEGFRETRLRTD